MTSSKPTKVGSFHSQEKEKKMAQTNRTTFTGQTKLGEWS